MTVIHTTLALGMICLIAFMMVPLSPAFAYIPLPNNHEVENGCNKIMEIIERARTSGNADQEIALTKYYEVHCQ